ncbi:MAG: VanZ family protein [Spirochaetales bacterium]|nr:VanZ family protein [Spirochaetales bacterium]
MFILIALTILILSLIPVPPQPEFLKLSDKLNHLIAYCLLSCCFILAFKSNKTHGVRLFLITMSCCTLYGCIIEFLQSFTNRTPEFWDIMADFIGSIIGIFVAGIILCIKKKL